MVRFLCAAVIIACLYSCSSGNDGGITLLKEVNSSLIRSNQITTFSTENIYQSLEDKIKKPESSDRASRWFPKAKKIRKLTESILQDVKRIKSDLIEEAGFDPLKEEKPESAKEAVDYIFKEHKEGQLLFQKLALYKKDMLAVEPLMEEYIRTAVIVTGIDSLGTTGSFIDKYFKNTLLDAITMLNKIENDILITENKLTGMCNDNVGVGCNLGIVFYKVLIGQNSNVVRPGEKMQIRAGLGHYEVELKPVISIAGKHIPLNEIGFSQYDFNASSKPGFYSLPVQIKFFDHITGEEVTIQETVKYTVTDY